MASGNIDMSMYLDLQEPKEWQIISCLSPVQNRGARDAAALMLAGGFALFDDDYIVDHFATSWALPTWIAKYGHNRIII